MIVLDSSFLIAFHNNRDFHHGAACAQMKEFLGGQWGQGLLLEYVFLEVETVLLLRNGLAAAKEVASLLIQSEELEFVPCSDFFRETLETFLGQKETSLSFTDAAIVTTALRRAEGRVLSFDQELLKYPGVVTP